MAESTMHRRAKKSGLGRPQTEIPISGNRRLDAKSRRVAREVERSGSPAKIEKAIRRLNTQKNVRKELLVRNQDLDKAKEIAKRVAMGRLTIQNLSRTKRRFLKQGG
jgi:hypothetical protein